MVSRIGWWPVCVFLFCAVAPSMQAAQSDRPNFVLLIADDMGWEDCGPYGNRAVRTPNIDRLAKQGMRFDSAILTCSSCSPSRASIMTGRYPHNTDAEQLHWPLPRAQVTFVEKLKAAEDRIVLRHLHVPTADGYVDQLFIWLENLGFAHCRKFTAATLNTANANFLITTHPFVKLFRYKGMTYVDRYIHKAGMSVLPTGA